MMSIQRWPSPGENEYLEETRSPRVELVNAVARLQKELEEFRAESGYGSARWSAIPAQTSGGSGFTSTSVPMYAGKSSWDQYRHVFQAIVCSNGWDGVTAALQLVSHLEGDALNVALLVSASQRVLPGALVKAQSDSLRGPPGVRATIRQCSRPKATPIPSTHTAPAGNCRFSTETFWRLVFSHKWFRIHLQRDEVESQFISNETKSSWR